MAKTFTMLVGWVLIIVGVLNFFDLEIAGLNINLMPAHGVFHIVAGILGVGLAKSHAQGYALWVGIIGLVLAALGFLLGAPVLLGIINLPSWISVVHLVLGVWGLWTYMASKKSMGAMPTGSNPAM